jgi:hypothetical protein
MLFFLIDETVVSQCNNGTLKQGLQNPRTFNARFGFYFKIVGWGEGAGSPTLLLLLLLLLLFLSL